MSDCVDCGREVKNKNASGHYRDRCHPCIREAACSERDAQVPMHGCSCPVCERSR